MSSAKTSARAVASVVPVIQQSVMDCAVACVAMLTGHPYSNVFSGSATTAKIVRKSGAIEVDLRRLARGVGAKLKKVKPPNIDLDDDTGILWLGSTNPKIPGHAALLFRGVLIDPGTGLLWDPQVFLAENPHYVIEALFELV